MKDFDESAPWPES